MHEGGFAQGDKVRDFIFPLALAVGDRTDPNAEFRFERYLGTAFLIGNRGFALTAAHVVRGIGQADLCGIFVHVDSSWRCFPIAGLECHPTQDVAVVQLQGGRWASPFRFGNRWVGSASEYHLMGYPADAQLRDDHGLSAPDLVYLRGYVRRRISRRLKGLTGDAFIELSQPAYGGCSGGPLWTATTIGGPWLLSGMYLGFLPVSDPGVPFLSVGYGVRDEAFRDWKPSIVGRDLVTEAADGGGL